MRIAGWTLKDIVQGRPLAHPTHPMFVHFPTALYPAAMVFAVLSRTSGSGDFATAAAILIVMGFAGAVGAVVTGLADWWGMVRGSTKRRRVTRHLLVQMAAQAFAAAALVIQLAAGQAVTPVAAIGALAVAVVLLTWGNWLGGLLVYRWAMRVGGKPEPSPPRPRERL